MSQGHERQETGAVERLAAKAIEMINKRSAAQQLLIGSLSGFGTGTLVIRIGKTAAFTIGAGIILFQVAQHQKLTAMDWDKVKEKAQETSKQLSPKIKANAERFGRSNKYFAAGFVGGFLMGLST